MTGFPRAMHPDRHHSNACHKQSSESSSASVIIPNGPNSHHLFLSNQLAMVYLPLPDICSEGGIPVWEFEPRLFGGSVAKRIIIRGRGSEEADRKKAKSSKKKTTLKVKKKLKVKPKPKRSKAGSKNGRRKPEAPDPDSKAIIRCELCPKVFRTRVKCKEHQWIHTGIKTYLCPLCPQQFAIKGNVKRHLNNVHGKDKKKPEVARVLSSRCKFCGRFIKKQCSAKRKNDEGATCACGGKEERRRVGAGTGKGKVRYKTQFIRTKVH